MKKAPTSLALAIRSARLAKKMTQKNVAAALDVTQATVSSWEAGRQKPSSAVLRRLAKVIEMPAHLIGLKGDRFAVSKTDQELEADFYTALSGVVETLRPKIENKRDIQATVKKIVEAWSTATFKTERPPTPNVSSRLPPGTRLICNLCDLEVEPSPEGSCSECGLSCGWNSQLPTSTK